MDEGSHAFDLGGGPAQLRELLVRGGDAQEGTAVAEEPRALFRGEGRVEGDGDPAEAEHGQVGDGPLVAVLREEGDALAVPHAIGMTATRTAIAVGLADPSIRWGDGRVQVVTMVAFSESDREAFQTVFEQLVEVFSERDSVQRILRRGTTFAAFLDELVAVVDG